MELSEQGFPAVGLKKPPACCSTGVLLCSRAPCCPPHGERGWQLPPCPARSYGGADKSSVPERRLLFMPASQRSTAAGMNAASSCISGAVGTDGVRVERGCGNVSLLRGVSGSFWLVPKPLLGTGREGSCSEMGREDVPALLCRLRSPSALQPLHRAWGCAARAQGGFEGRS